MAVTLGSELGGYQILSLLGEGGMGAVYRAYDPRLDRFVALKLLHEGHADNAARRRRLLREARSASALNHPHICTVHEVGEADGEAFMVMEFVDGRSLRELIAFDGLPIHVAIRYAIQIADALAHAHDRGILHRDLKTGNVMITADERVKVLDFGVARRLGGNDFHASPDSTATVEVAQVTGTLAYMAPELLQGDAADARNDVWSLGVMLYEMTAGTLPFSGRTNPELSAAILRENPKPLPANVPAGLRLTILRCLSKQPAQRYRHPREVAAALETTGEDSAVPSTKRSGRQPTRSPSARLAVLSGARRVSWWTAAAVALSVVVISTLWWFLQQDRPVRATGNRLVSSLPGGSAAASFSPDGTMMVFQNGEVDGASQLWIKNLAQGDPLQITFLENEAARPCWSPKSDQILFNHRGGIWSVPPLGGQPRSIIEQGNNPSFSRDGEHVVYETPDRGIWLANADGSSPRRLASRRLQWPATPALSPDARQIAYFQSDDGGPSGDFWVISTAGGTPRRLTFDSSFGGRPVWTPDGRFIIFSSTRHGSENLWRVPAGGGTPEPVTFGAGQDGDPAVSPDGKRLIYTNARTAYALMLRDAITGNDTELLERRAPMDFPRFSHHGDRIAFFLMVETGDIHLFTVRPNAGELRQITHTAGQKNFFPHWSADDRVLFFTRHHPDVSFRKVAARGGDSVELGPWDTQNWAQANPSGRAVVYQRLSGTQEVATIIRDLKTGQETALDLLLRQIRWSRDGQTVFGNDPASGSLVSCPPGPGACRVITRGYTARPSGNGARIFFLRATNPQSRYRELWSIGYDGQHEKRVGMLGAFGIDVDFDVSRDDRIVYVQTRQGKAELWQADLQ